MSDLPGANRRHIGHDDDASSTTRHSLAPRVGSSKLAQLIASRTSGNWADGVRSLASEVDPHAVHVLDGWRTPASERAKCSQCRAEADQIDRQEGPSRARGKERVGQVAGQSSLPRPRSEMPVLPFLPGDAGFKRKRKKLAKGAREEQERMRAARVRRMAKALKRAEGRLLARAKSVTPVGRIDAGQGLWEPNIDMQVDSAPDGPSYALAQTQDDTEGITAPRPTTGEPHAAASSGHALQENYTPSLRARQGWETRRRNERTADALLEVLGPHLDGIPDIPKGEEDPDDPEHCLRGLELHSYRFYESHHAIDLPRQKETRPFATKRRQELEEAGALSPTPESNGSKRRMFQKANELRFADGQLVQPGGSGYRRRDMLQAMDPAALAALGALTEQLVASGLADTGVAITAQQIFLSREGETTPDGVQGTDGLRATAVAAAYAAEALRKGRIHPDLQWLSHAQTERVVRIISLMDESREQKAVETELEARRARVRELVDKVLARREDSSGPNMAVQPDSSSVPAKAVTVDTDGDIAAVTDTGEDSSQA